MRNPFRRKALTATPAVVSAIGDGWRPIPLLGSGSRQRITDAFTTAQDSGYAWRYTHSPATRTVIDRIVLNIGQLDLRLYEEISEKERKPRPDHPAALSLRYPDEMGNVTSDGLIRSLFLDWLIHDNAYALIQPNRIQTQQITLRRIPTYMVEVQGDSLFEVSNYRVWPQGAWTGGQWGGSGHYFDVAPGAMLHWHGEHPTDPRVGLSKLDTLGDVIAEDAALQAAIVELANSGMTQPVWAFRPENAPELSNRTRMLMEEDLANRLRKRNRVPIVLEEGTEFRSFGVSPQDAQMMEVRMFVIKRVAAEYGVPLGIVGLEPLTAEARSQFLSDVLQPSCEHFTRMLNQRVLVNMFDETAFTFEFDIDEKFAGDSRLTAYVSATGRPVMLTNEARAKFNLPPVDGGDEIVTPSNVILGDPNKAPKPSPGVMPIQDPNKPPQDGSYRQDQGQTPIPSGNQGAQKAISPEDKLPRHHPRQAGDMRRQEQAIPMVEKVVRRNLNRVGRQAEKSVLANGGGVKALNWELWTTQFAKELLTVLTKIVKAEASTYMFRLAGRGEFDVSRVEHYLEAKATGSAQGIGERFRAEIAEIGLQGALERIDAHASAAGTHAAVTSMSFARESAARQAPGAEYRQKVWIADTARHRKLDGVAVGLNEKWPGGIEPGTQPNCKCSCAVI